MGESNVNLASLIGSRICHDLISPIGAITNGLELLGMTGAAEGPEMELINDSAGHAGARVRFFRLAYGHAGDQMISSDEVAGILRDMEHGTRTKTSWAIQGGVPRAEVRLALLAMQCCETALPLGGNVKITCQNGTWEISGHGPRLAIEPEIWEGLSGSVAPDKITPALVQFALLPVAAAENSRRVNVSANEQSVTLSF